MLATSEPISISNGKAKQEGTGTASKVRHCRMRYDMSEVLGKLQALLAEMGMGMEAVYNLTGSSCVGKLGRHIYTKIARWLFFVEC